MPDIPPGNLRSLIEALHHGGMAGINDAWQALARYCEERGLDLMPGTGPSREVYLESPPDRQDEWVTELQQPVG